MDGHVKQPPIGAASRAGSADDRWHGIPLAVWMAGGLALLHAVLGLFVFDPTPHTGGDNAAYISLARSLLENGAYIETFDPAAPPHAKYPPIFPGILALGLLAGLAPWAQLKLIILGFSTAAVGFTYLWLRERRGANFALAVTLLVAASPGVLHLSHWILSDVPFWAFTMLALWAFERAGRGERAGFAVGVAATVLAYFTRSAGLPLFVAACGWLAWRREGRRLAILAAAVVPLAVLWWLRGRMIGGEYVSEFLLVNPYNPELGRIGPVDFVQRIIENGRQYGGEQIPRMLAGFVGAPMIALSVTVVALAVAGWVRRLRDAGAAEFFFPLYAGLIMVWPAVWAGDRFLLPIYPLLLAYAGGGLLWAVGRLRSGAAAPAAIAAVLLVLAIGAPVNVGMARGAMQCTQANLAGEPYACLPDDWRSFFELAEWSADRLPDDAVVISRKPRLFYALSGHPGEVYPMRDDADAFFDLVDETGARYLALGRIDDLWRTYLAPVLAERSDAFCAAYTLGEGGAVLFGIRSDPAARRPTPGAGADGELKFAPCRRSPNAAMP